MKVRQLLGLKSGTGGRAGLITVLLSWLLVTVIGFAVLYPLWRLVVLAIAPEGSLSGSVIADVVGAPWFGGAVRNTAIVVGCSSVLAVLVAGTLTWINERTDASLGWFGQLLPMTPLLVPPVAVAAGWVILAIPRIGLLRIPFGDLIPNIFSYGGLIFVLTLVMVPYVYLLLQTAFRNMDPALEEASLVSGAGVIRTLLRVSLPSLKHALAAGVLLACVVGISQFAVPTIIGTPARIDVLSVRAVRFVTATYPAELGGGAVVGLFMMIATGTLWYLYFRVARAGRFAQIGTRAPRGNLVKLGAWKWPIRLGMLLFLFVTTILPLIALVIVALQPYWTANIDVSSFGLSNFRAVFGASQLGGSFFNSIRYALVGAAIGTGLVVILTGASKIAHLRSAGIGLTIMKIPAAIANIVLGVGFLIAFYGPPFRLGGTAILLVGAYVIVFLPHASIVGESATAQVPQDLLEASEVSGASHFRTHRKVLFPLSLPGYLSAYALLFALMAAEVSTSRILARPGTRVVGFSIIQVYESGGFGQLAVLALVISLVILTAMASITGIGQLLRKRWS